MIRENIERVEKLREAIKNHPMCGRYEESDSNITVIYPDGDFLTHGCRARFPSKAKSMQAVLDVMERHWMESYP